MKINDVFANDYNNMIFDYLNNMPWDGKFLASELNLLYLDHSGMKTISTLVQRILGANDTLTTENKTLLARLIETQFLDNWRHIWDAYTAEYKPIENYSMVESEDIKDTRNVDKQGTNGVKFSENKNFNRNVDGSSDEENASNIYGYDNPESSPVSSEKNKMTSKDVEGIIENNNNESTNTENSKENQTGTQIRTLTRNGNIGVTTSQQMIDSELKLREFNFFKDTVFKDIDSLLTSRIYSFEEL